MADFVHLHVHTEYSLLDGACRLSQLAQKAQELGQKAIAITDHGVMYGVIDFYRECKKIGIKPIIGCEVYVAPRGRTDKQHKIDSSPYHLVLLCKNETGYKNLIKMVSTGFTEGFYSRPRIDRELLEKHHEGLICLSACLAGEVPRNINKGDYESAKKTVEYFRDLFGEGNYYIEIQNHGIDDQIRALPMLERLSRECGVPMAATNDVHYINKEDSYMQKVLVCIATNRTIYDDNSMEFETQEFYLKSGDEMSELFSKYEGAIKNTVKIAEQCNLEFTFGEIKLPHFTAPGGAENKEYFRNMCYSGLKRLYGENPDSQITERLEYELGIIERMGYVDYYLIVHDFIAYAKSVGIPVGPGRGSGAGSIAAYCTGITGIDPMKYNLLFERFLNPERISMPDFDIDFCYERRQEVIDYVIQKYGADHVAQIITFGTMAARGSIRDVGRALGVSYATCDTIAKAIPFALGMTLEKALAISVDLKKLYESDKQNKELIDMAGKIEGMVRHASTHAAGVVITQDTVDSYVPLSQNDQSIVTQFTMTTLEELGLLKVDFLGLRNLTVISDVEKANKLTNPEFSMENIPLGDPDVYEMFAKGQTNGVFQFESGGMKNVLIQLVPENIEDLIAVISLYRPGPMDSIPVYIENRHNPEKVTYKHPLLKPILDVTYGCIVYQEQVMQICRSLAGYSYGRSDLVRRAMSKKKHDVMQKERHSFVYGSDDCVGCIANGVPENIANQIFDEMTSFASYAFNKSHAAAYALVAYQTAYLKCHYPKEYMAALLTSILDNSDKVIDYISECKRMNISVLPPDVNESVAGFTVSSGKIRFGLLAVKNLGRNFIAELVRERAENGLYKDMLDFISRMYGRDMSKRSVESLIKCGALDCFGHSRAQMIAGFEQMIDNIEHDRHRNVSGQMDLFNLGGESSASPAYILPDAEEYSVAQLLAMEKETSGLYLSGHPLSGYEKEQKALNSIAVSEIVKNEDYSGKAVTLVGIINSKRRKTTKNNELMAFIMLEDNTASIECIIFPRVFEECSSCIEEGAVVAVRGTVKSGAEDEPQITCNAVMSIEKAMNNYVFTAASSALPQSNNGSYQSHHEIKTAEPQTNKASSRPGLYLKFSHKGCAEEDLCHRVLQVFEGNLPVYYYYSDKNQYVLAEKANWISLNNTMALELKRILGDNNVAIKQ